MEAGLTDGQEITRTGGLVIAELFEEYKEPLHRYAINLTRRADLADDLVQETFIRALAHHGLLDRLNGYHRRAWLYRVLKNRFLDQQRAHRRRRTMVDLLAKSVSIDDSPCGDVRLFELLCLVPERYCSLLEKRYVLGMTSVEIGRELGVPAATVRSRLRLALARLRTDLFKVHLKGGNT